MSIVGINDFRFGETLAQRVNAGGPVCRNIGGFDNRYGYLKPDLLPTRHSLSALGGAIPAQVPLAFRDENGVRFIVRDADHRLRVLNTDGSWGTGGDWKPCALLHLTDLVNCGTHDYVDGQAIRFGTTVGGITAGVTYYVRDIAGYNFKIALTPGGAAINLTLSTNNTVAAEAGPVFSVISDNIPFRANEGTVWGTGGANAALMFFEPDSPSTRSRPVGLRGPQWYEDKTKPTVSSGAHPAAQLFSLAAAETNNPDSHFEITAAATGLVLHYPYEDYEALQFGPTCTASLVCATYDLGEAGVDISNKVYLAADLILKYTGTDPREKITAAGVFINSQQTLLPSGFDFVLYSDQACGTVIRNHAIPQLDTSGVMNRVVIHLGNSRATDPQACTMAATGDLVTCTAHALAVNDAITFHSATGGVTAGTAYYVVATPSADTFQFSATLGGGAFNITEDGSNTWTQRVKGLSINTAGYFVAADSGCYYTLWLYASAFGGGWNFVGNTLLPEVVNCSSPWYNLLPPSPGWASTCAVVLETFPESAIYLEPVPAAYASTPNRPLVRFAYAYRGRDRLSTSLYKTMISDPSEQTVEVLFDPWLYYDVGATLPTKDSNSVIDEYGDYATHVLVYRQRYTGFGALSGQGALGSWSGWDHLAYVDIAASFTYRYADKQNQACTMDAAADTVTSAAHDLNLHDVVIFGSSTGGVEVGIRYFVIAVTTDTFQFSATPDGSAFNISGDGANTWSLGLPELSIDDKDIPAIIESNHAVPDSARYALAADQRLYYFCRAWDQTNGKWSRACDGGVSNRGDRESFPIEESDPPDPTQGEDLTDFAPNASTAKALVAWGSSKAVFTDVGDWELVGAQVNEWRFIKGTNVPCQSGVALVACPGRGILYPGPDHFYLSDLTATAPISDGLIEFDWIDWTAPHGAVSSKDRYVMFCTYNDPDQQTAFALLIYDFRTGSWRHRNQLSYQFAGMCVDEATGEVYALTTGGDIVKVFGGTEDYGGDQEYTLWVQGLVTAAPTQQRRVGYLAAEMFTDQPSLELEMTVYQQGRAIQIIPLESQTLASTRNQYRWNVPLTGDAAGVKLVYRGAYPPSIYALAFDADDGSTG